MYLNEESRPYGRLSSFRMGAVTQHQKRDIQKAPMKTGKE
jgi:hypothetical protein